MLDQVLRVLYLTSSPGDGVNDIEVLRVDVEMRQVREAVQKAVHRDLLEIDYRPAATPESLLDGLNQTRPQIVHFAGHGGARELLFDGTELVDPQVRPVSYNHIARALAATDNTPILLLLNACNTLDGAEILLDAVSVVVAMSAEITDLAATIFATKFYAAIASAQSVDSAIRQGSLGVEIIGADEGWKPQVIARDGVDLASLVLIKPSNATPDATVFTYQRLSQIEATVSWTHPEGPEVVTVDLAREVIDTCVATESHRLAIPAPESQGFAIRMIGAQTQQSYEVDRREYLSALPDAIRAAALTKVVESPVGKLAVTVTNPTDQPLLNARLVLTIHDPIEVLDSPLGGLPPEPIPAGQIKPVLSLGDRFGWLPKVSSPQGGAPTHAGDRTTVAFAIGDLHPFQSVVLGQDVTVVLTAIIRDTNLNVGWQVTSSDRTGMAFGELRLRQPERIFSPSDLLAFGRS